MPDATHPAMRGTALLAAVLTVVIAAAAFVLSFFALWELATMAGVFPRRWAWLLPIVVDAYIVLSTLLLVYSTRRGDQKGRRYHLSMLVIFSSISVMGNGYHALVVGGGELPALVSAAIAIVAPLALLASTHGLIVHLWHAQVSADSAVVKDEHIYAPVDEPADVRREYDRAESETRSDLVRVQHAPAQVSDTTTAVAATPVAIDRASDADESPADIEVTECDLEFARRVCVKGRVKNDEQTVARALVLERRGLPRDDVATLVGVHRTTVLRWAEIGSQLQNAAHAQTTDDVGARRRESLLPSA